MPRCGNMHQSQEAGVGVGQLDLATTADSYGREGSRDRERTTFLCIRHVSAAYQRTLEHGATY